MVNPDELKNKDEVPQETPEQIGASRQLGEMAQKEEVGTNPKIEQKEEEETIDSLKKRIVDLEETVYSLKEDFRVLQREVYGKQFRG